MDNHVTSAARRLPGPGEAAPAPDAVVVFANRYRFEAGEQTRKGPGVQSRMLLWCLRGRGTVRVNEHEIELGPDLVVAMPWGHAVTYRADADHPMQVGGVHVIPHHDRGAPVQFGVAHDASSPLHRHPARRDAELPGCAGVLCGDLTEQRALAHLLEYTVHRFDNLGAGDEPVMRSLGELILLELQQGVRAGRLAAAGRRVPRLVSEASHWVRDHLRQPFTVADVASAAACSMSTLQRAFRRDVGVSPQEFVAGARLQRAQELLRTTRMPVQRVADEVGFADPLYFSRWFKHHAGLSPRAFRARAGLL